MRFSRLVLSCSVVGTLLAAPMAAPASASAAAAGNCARSYVGWLQANVSPGAVIDADLDFALSIWNETWNYVNCQTAEVDDIVDGGVDPLVACIEGTTFYQNLRSSAPLLRYTDAGVNLLGGHFSVYPFNLVADAQGVANCVV